MKLVFFELTDGGEVGMNRQHIRRIARNALNDRHTLIYFDKEDYVSVAMEFKAVALTLQL